MLPDTKKDHQVSTYTTAISCLAPTSPGEEAQMTRMGHTELIRAAQRSDAAAFQHLGQQYDRAILGVAVHLTGSVPDGQDLYQEAFLRACLRLPRFRFECSFYTWICRIVTNLCRDHLRRNGLRCRYSTGVCSPGGDQHHLSDQVSDEPPLANPELFRGPCSAEAPHLCSGYPFTTRTHGFRTEALSRYAAKTVAGILNTTEGTEL